MTLMRKLARWMRVLSVAAWLHPCVFVYCGTRYSCYTGVLCYAAVCMIIDRRVMQDKARRASVDCFAVSSAGLRPAVRLQTARAV